MKTNNRFKIIIVLIFLFAILTNPNKENLESKLKIETTRDGYNTNEIEISRNNYLFFSTYDCIIFDFDRYYYPEKKVIRKRVPHNYIGIAGSYWKI